MKALFVIARMNIGGTAQYLVNLSEGLNRRGIQVQIATGYVQGEETEISNLENLEIIRIPHLGRKISPIKDLKAFKELRTTVENFRPEVIVSHTFKAGLLARLINTSIPRIHIFHGHLFNDKSHSLFARKIIFLIEKFLVKKTQKIVTVGERVRHELVSMGLFAESKAVSIAPPMTPLQIPSKEAAKSALGISAQSEFLVVWMGRLTPVKDPALFVEIARKLPHLKFLMFGGGELLPELLFDPPVNLQYLGWAQREYIHAVADLEINTSGSEGMPLAVIEAQMAGVPVIAANVGAISEIIIDGKSGFMVERNSAAYAEAIQTLYENRKLRLNMSAFAVEATRKAFDESVICHKFIEEFISLLPLSREQGNS